MKGMTMADFISGMSDDHLAEIKARLAKPAPFAALSSSNPERSPVAIYVRLLRQDQTDLVKEIDRLKAELAILQGRPVAISA
jgi:hypothetical protein